MSDDDALLYGAPVHVLGGEDEPMAYYARWRRSGWREMEMNGTDDRLIGVSILARRRGYLPDILIAIFGTDREHRYACVTDVSHMPYDPYDETVEPYEFRLRDEGAQDLMDSLWRCGLRPTEAAGSAGAMAEAQKHLDSLLRENVWLRQQIDRLLAGKGE